jgi:hypothetical protein
MLSILNNAIASCSCDQFEELMSMNFIPRLIRRLKQCNSTLLQEQIVWIIDNIGRDFGNYRKQLIEEGVIDVVLEVRKNIFVFRPILTSFQQILENGCTKEMKSRISSAVRTLTTDDGVDVVRGVKLIQPLSMLMDLVNSDVQFNVCCSLTSLTATDPEQCIKMKIMTCDSLPTKLMQLSGRNTRNDAQLFALHTVSNLCADASQDHLKELVRLQLLPMLLNNITSAKHLVALKACDSLFSLCIGFPEIIGAVVEAGFLPFLVDLSKTHASKDVQMSASYAISSLFHGASISQVHILVNADCLERVVALLDATDPDTESVECICEGLQCLENVFSKFDCLSDFDNTSSLVQNVGGWQSVTRLRCSKHNEVRELAENLDKDRLRSETIKYEKELVVNEVNSDVAQQQTVIETTSSTGLYVCLFVYLIV